MSETKCTPSPWYAYKQDSGLWAVRSKATGRAVCKGLSEGDARVIASAPEILEACRDTLAQMREQYDPSDGEDDDWCRLFRKLESSIAKAEGK